MEPMGLVEYTSRNNLCSTMFKYTCRNNRNHDSKKNRRQK